MLVLSRKKNEEIVVHLEGQPEPLRIMVVAIRGDKVRLGLEAPKSVTVHRREVWEAAFGELDK
jgi:carbon storage regulator